jgi:hypothetical protein
MAAFKVMINKASEIKDRGLIFIVSVYTILLELTPNFEYTFPV